MEHSTFFALISRMKYVNRWGLMHNGRMENLMEHSFETAVIAGALANIENTMFGGNYNADAVTQAALFHDASEIITGDMPTPVKYLNGQLSNAYKAVENSANELLIAKLPEELADIYGEYFAPDKKTHQIVKAADKISALLKCEHEIKCGNHDFDSAKLAIEEKLKESDLKSVLYFMKHMLPAYRLTLDELTR